MTTAVAPRQEVDDATMFQVVANGDTSRLSEKQKTAYYRARCEAAGLDYRTAPFQFIKLQGREVLYALKAATDQLASKHGVRCEIVEQRTEHEIRIVTVRAIAKDGRQTDEIGAVPVAGLKGEPLCNALMKACTKAKRRAILSVCGLGMLDETELETIPGAEPAGRTVVVDSGLPTPKRKSETRAKLDATMGEIAAQPDLAPALRASIEAARERGAAPAALPAAADSASVGAAPPTDSHFDPHRMHIEVDGHSGDPRIAPGLAEDCATCDDTNTIVSDLDDELMPNKSDLASLHAAAREGGHPPEAVKAYMAEKYGVDSSKKLKLGQLRELRKRLRDRTQL